MNRDGRGKPGRIVLKNQPQLRLADVLRRRRSTLVTLVGELGLTTYAGLSTWCRRMGVVGPTEAEFVTAFPNASRVNSPCEGVVVLEAPAVVAELTGERIDIDPIDAPEEKPAQAEPVTPQSPLEGPPEVPEASQKKRRPKKDEPLRSVDKLS